MNLRLANEAATVDFAAVLAGKIKNIQVITLSGDLGAGKTTLVRALLRALDYSGRVKSPTYTLVEPYEINNRPIYHFDLYRLAHPEELEYLGFTDYMESDALCLIEWPEHASGALPGADLEISLSYLESGRQLSVLAGTPSGEDVCQSLEKSITGTNNLAYTANI
ncbi:MAG: tRNA (adenosine(37)-N6)-threonylcarbamoyltransferase complex ATPase subunit type 1 TsaE [Thiothrix sp.]|nr:MAG: tRNA (adenosine(37)-N6)-threonylcarbamoyltransferase complex ATPase subunit type 1 TsaE [Thiothrix sp.]